MATGHPNVFADGQADPKAFEGARQRALTGYEIAIFVEHAIIGKPAFSIDGANAPAFHPRRRVVQAVLIAIDEPDHGDQTARRASQRGQRFAVVGDERWF